MAFLPRIPRPYPPFSTPPAIVVRGNPFVPGPKDNGIDSIRTEKLKLNATPGIQNAEEFSSKEALK